MNWHSTSKIIEFEKGTSKDFVCKELNNPIYLQIWESDYKNNPEKIIQDILLYYNINLESDKNEIYN